MNSIRTVEFLGGPLDGGGVPIVVGTTMVVIRDSGRVYRYDADEVTEGPKVRVVFRLTGIAPEEKELAMCSDKAPAAWISAEDERYWDDTSLFWVTIRCKQDGTTGVGLMGGPLEKRVAFTRGVNIHDGRDYVVTHYCPASLPWPPAAGE